MSFQDSSIQKINLFLTFSLPHSCFLQAKVEPSTKTYHLGFPYFMSLESWNTAWHKPHPITLLNNERSVFLFFFSPVIFQRHGKRTLVVVFISKQPQTSVMYTSDELLIISCLLSWSLDLHRSAVRKAKQLIWSVGYRSDSPSACSLNSMVE